MTARGVVQFLPPIEIRFFTKSAAHCFDDIARIAKHFNRTRLAQSVQTERCGCNFGLLIGRLAPKLTDGFPVSFKTEQRDGSRARIFPPVADTRTVANY